MLFGAIVKGLQELFDVFFAFLFCVWLVKQDHSLDEYFKAFFDHLALHAWMEEEPLQNLDGR